MVKRVASSDRIQVEPFKFFIKVVRILKQPINRLNLVLKCLQTASCSIERNEATRK